MAKEIATAGSDGGKNQLAVVDINRFLTLADANSAELIQHNLSGESVGEFDLSQVRVPAAGGTAWELPGADPAKSFDGIIVHVARRRAYWQSSVPSGDPPDCYSKDLLHGVGNPGGECESCPNNEFGTSGNERGKACKESRTLFVCRESDMLPLALHVPASSLKPLKKYMLTLKQPYWMLLTRFSLVKRSNKDGVNYAEIEFSTVGALPAEHVQRIKDYALGLGKVFG